VTERKKVEVVIPQGAIPRRCNVKHANNIYTMQLSRYCGRAREDGD